MTGGSCDPPLIRDCGVYAWSAEDNVVEYNCEPVTYIGSCEPLKARRRILS